MRETVRAASAGPQDVESVLEPFGANLPAGSYGIPNTKYASNLKNQVETLEFEENRSTLEPSMKRIRRSISNRGLCASFKLETYKYILKNILGIFDFWTVGSYTT